MSLIRLTATIRIAAILLSIPLFFQILSPARSEPFVAQRFAVSVEGQGPDVIMIPGLGSSAEVWRPEARRLSAHYRLHLIQIAGFAGAPARVNATPPLLGPITDELAAYIRANGLNRPVVVGHSLGGLLGMMLADKAPDVVGKLVIVDSLPFFGMLNGPTATVESVTPVAAQFRDQILSMSQAEYATGQPRTMAILIKSKGPESQAALVASQASDHKVVALAMYEDFTTDLRPRLSSMKTPTLILYAYDAAMGLPPAAMDGLYNSAYAALPNKRLARIDNSFHFIQIDQPDVFHAQLEAFLRAR